MESQTPLKGRKIKKKLRPWLKRDGSEIPTSELREIAKAWDYATWSDYLEWYETKRREDHVHPYRYDIKLDELRQSVFEQMDQSTKQTKVNLCERLLSDLPEHQQRILKSHFFAGLPDVEIGPRVGRARRTISRQRNQALETLKRGLRGDARPKCRFMRGKKISAPRFWDENATFFLKERRFHKRDEQAATFESIKPRELRDSILELSPRAQRALYLRFWCDCTYAEIGRELDMGLNTVDSIIDTAVSRVKRNFMAKKLHYFPGDWSPYGA